MTTAPIKLIGSSYYKQDAIQERVLNSFLEFIFYETNKTYPTRRYLPFLGDVVISESRKANYIDYTPISRNSSIPYYTGSESRIFKLSYEISPNFLIQNPGFINYIKSFRDVVSSSSDSANPRTSFFPDRFATTPQQPISFDRPYGVKKLTENGVNKTELLEDTIVYSFIDYQINLIRSSVVNNATDPTKGPPIVRLNHGLLYQNIPCICKDYSLEQVYDDSNKKNMHTKYKISKNKVQLSLNLQEVRLGNYLSTEFDPRTSTDAQDNIVGWEQILNPDYKSFDPISPIYKY